MKKSVKKSVKTSKSTSKKKTVSTTESSSITSSKAASFENSFSNGSVEVVEQHHVEEHQTTGKQASVTSSKSIDSSSSGKDAIESIHDSTETAPPLENGEKKKLGGKKKSKKSKKSDSEKENISVVSAALSLISHLQASFAIFLCPLSPRPPQSLTFEFLFRIDLVLCFLTFASRWLSCGAFSL